MRMLFATLALSLTAASACVAAPRQAASDPKAHVVRTAYVAPARHQPIVEAMIVRGDRGGLSALLVDRDGKVRPGQTITTTR